jgi:HEAT repeat protein
VRVVAKCATATGTQVALAAIKDPDSDVRLVACDALGKRGGPPAVAALCDALKLDLESDVRLAAAKALGETHDPAAVPALGAALEDQDPAMQYRAVNSLRAISGKDLGNDVQRWRLYAKGQLPPEPTFAERLRNLF